MGKAPSRAHDVGNPCWCEVIGLGGIVDRCERGEVGGLECCVVAGVGLVLVLVLVLVLFCFLVSMAILAARRRVQCSAAQCRWYSGTVVIRLNV